MSHATAISLKKLSKTYRIWKSPEARLQAALAGFFTGSKGANGKYHDFQALAETDLEIRVGECVGIIGLNGSGKSTLLQMITGTLQASTGTLAVNGRVAALLELGAGFNPDFSGRENVYLNAAILGLSREEVNARFADIAAFADIGDYIEQPVKTYSSGMYVRLGFAVLTQVKPDILIIDEALSVGDFIFQQKCFDVMREFRKKGVTFIFVSHSMAMVLELCDRAVVLEKGQLIFDGPAAKAVAVYEESAVRARYGGESLAPEAKAGTVPVERHGGAADALPPTYAITTNVDQAVLRAEPGSIHTTKATLLFARFMDASFHEKIIFRVGDDIIITIGLKVLESLAEPHVGFKIRDRLGRIIFETSSLCMRQFPAAVHAGEIISGNFRFKVTMSEGEYSLVVGFAEGSVGDRDYRQALLYVQQVRTFTVVKNPSDILWSGISHLQPRFGWSIFKDTSLT